MKLGSRYNQLVEYLKGLNYDKYIWKLNELVKDPKLRFLLNESFGGYLSDDKLKFSVIDIPVRKLVPCQNEIDVTKSLKYGLTKPESLASYFKNPVVIKTPIITYNGNFIIDGHHRWSQVYCFNIDAKMTAWNYEGDFSAMQMLKIMQAAIASDLGEVPVHKVEGINLLNVDIEDIKNYIREVADPKFYDEYSRCSKCSDDPEEVISIIASNCESMQSDNNCIKDAPNRGFMPQTDEAPSILEDIKEGVVVMSDQTRTKSAPKVITSESNYYVDIDSDRIYVKIGEHDADHEDAPYEEYTYDFDKKEWDPSIPELPERIKKLISNYIKDTDVFSDKSEDNGYSEAHEMYKDYDYSKRSFSSDQEMISKLRDLNKVDITLIPDEVAYEEFKEAMINDYDFDTVELVETIMMEDDLYDSQINKLVAKSGLATDRIVGCCDHFIDFMFDQGVIE